MKESVLSELKKHKLVSVIRNSNKDNISQIIKALYLGGIRAVEITAETFEFNHVMDVAVKEYGDKMLIGAGTILDAETARTAILSGAKFIVSPILDVNTIKLCNRYGVVSSPGTFTPTEILTAYKNGADLVKVFPANIVGPDYLKSIQGPLGKIPIMATGGINLENINNYLDLGAQVVGVGSELVNTNELTDESSYYKITKKAEMYINKIN